MDKSVLVILDVIANSGNIRKLLTLGFSYREIADQTEKAIEMGLLLYSDERVTLSEKGRDLLEKNRAKLKIIDKELWIQRDKKSQIEKIDSNDIFLPSRDELSF